GPAVPVSAARSLPQPAAGGPHLYRGDDVRWKLLRGGVAGDEQAVLHRGGGAGAGVGAGEHAGGHGGHAPASLTTDSCGLAPAAANTASMSDSSTATSRISSAVPVGRDTTH